MYLIEIPALQVQEYWSFSNNVNLLASGASNALVGSGGSGIFAGKLGPLASFMSVPQKFGEENKNNRLLVADVPILQHYKPDQEKIQIEPENEYSHRSKRGTLLSFKVNDDRYISDVSNNKIVLY